MALPTQVDLQKLSISYLGAPFCQVEAKTLNTMRLDWSYLGAPFVAVIGSAPPASTFRPVLMFI